MNYKINSTNVLFTQLGEEGVIYDIRNNEYVTLNETFFKIIQGIEQGEDINKIVDKLYQEYAITKNECLIDVNYAIEQLMKKEYIIALV